LIVLKKTLEYRPSNRFGTDFAVLYGEYGLREMAMVLPPLENGEVT
jgi:hypothetical protein